MCCNPLYIAFHFEWSTNLVIFDLRLLIKIRLRCVLLMIWLLSLYHTFSEEKIKINVLIFKKYYFCIMLIYSMYLLTYILTIAVNTFINVSTNISVNIDKETIYILREILVLGYSFRPFHPISTIWHMKEQ